MSTFCQAGFRWQLHMRLLTFVSGRVVPLIIAEEWDADFGGPGHNCVWRGALVSNRQAGPSEHGHQGPLRSGVWDGCITTRVPLPFPAAGLSLAKGRAVLVCGRALTLLIREPFEPFFNR